MKEKVAEGRMRAGRFASPFSLALGYLWGVLGQEALGFFQQEFHFFEGFVADVLPADKAGPVD